MPSLWQKLQSIDLLLIYSANLMNFMCQRAGPRIHLTGYATTEFFFLTLAYERIRHHRHGEQALLTLDALRAQMRNAEPVLKALDLELERIRVDLREPGSVEACIKQVIEVIDTHLMEFKSNPILGLMAEELKAQYVEGIQSQATQSRS